MAQEAFVDPRLSSQLLVTEEGVIRSYLEKKALPPKGSFMLEAARSKCWGEAL